MIIFKHEKRQQLKTFTGRSDLSWEQNKYFKQYFVDNMCEQMNLLYQLCWGILCSKYVKEYNRVNYMYIEMFSSIMVFESQHLFRNNTFRKDTFTLNVAGNPSTRVFHGQSYQCIVHPSTAGGQFIVWYHLCCTGRLFHFALF